MKNVDIRQMGMWNIEMSSIDVFYFIYFNYKVYISKCIRRKLRQVIMRVREISVRFDIKLLRLQL